MSDYDNIHPNREGCFYLKKFEYKYQYKPAIYKYIMKEFIFNDNKKEREILELLVKGKTCEQIAMDVGYSPTTIKRRRRDLYEMTKDLMI